jgi:amino acid transporter
MTVKTSAYTIFKYMVNAVTLFSTIAWMGILFSHIRFMAACRAQGISRASLPYTSRLNPFLSWWGFIGTAVISITKGFDAIAFKFNKITFVTNYGKLDVDTPVGADA